MRDTEPRRGRKEQTAIVRETVLRNVTAHARAACVPRPAQQTDNFSAGPLADAGRFHGFHGTPLLRESLPARTEIIVRMRASYFVLLYTVLIT